MAFLHDLPQRPTFNLSTCPRSHRVTATLAFWLFLELTKHVPASRGLLSPLPSFLPFFADQSPSYFLPDTYHLGVCKEPVSNFRTDQRRLAQLRELRAKFFLSQKTSVLTGWQSTGIAGGEKFLNWEKIIFLKSIKNICLM